MAQSACMLGPGLLVLRLGLAVVSIAHGVHTLFGIMGGPGSGVGPGGLSHTAEQFTAMGLPGFAIALLAGITELAGGILLAVGYLTRWAAIALAALTAILAWKSQAPWGFFMNWVLEPGRSHGIEFSVVLITAYACLALIGAGDWSFDGRRAHRRSYVAAGRARLRGRS
jgi:putative oxidoreductase